MFQAAIMVILRLYDHPMIIFIFNIWTVYLSRPYVSRQGPYTLTPDRILLIIPRYITSIGNQYYFSEIGHFRVSVFYIHRRSPFSQHFFDEFVFCLGTPFLCKWVPPVYHMFFPESIWMLKILNVKQNKSTNRWEIVLINIYYSIKC